MNSEGVNRLLGILRITKDGNTELPHELQQIYSETVSQEGLQDNNVREVRLAIAMKAIRKGCDIEQVMKHLTWKDFEGFIARVLEENNYVCTESFRKKGSSIENGMEIDVIGILSERILVIDAKLWGVRRGKSSAIKSAVSKQVERAQRLASNLKQLKKRIPTFSPGNYTLHPIIVTWLSEELEIYDGVPIVPIFKLNAFLNELTLFEEAVLGIPGTFRRI